MCLRRYERRKNGKPHTYWALCESYRTAKSSRQRVVAYLGELQRSERPGWAELGRHLTGEARQRRPQLSLFDPPAHDVPQDDEPVLVRLSRVRLERTRDFGDVWLAWGLWRMLERVDGEVAAARVLFRRAERVVIRYEKILTLRTRFRLPAESRDFH